LIPVVTASGALLVASSLLFGSLQTANAPESTAAVPVRIDETVSRFEERPGVDQTTAPTPEASPTESPEASPAKKKQAKPKPEKVSWPTPTPPPPKPVAVKVSGSDSSGKLTPAKGNTCKASYYHEPQMTASGERFNPNAMTAAHKTLPLGSRVKVTNPANGKTVIVRINDRGPYISGRCLDLSRASFAKIGNLGQGVMKVVWQRV
jgi:rare lipoprotein A